MKIITKCVIDMKTSKVLECESYEYSGPIAECKGGSGGGSSGKVEYPTYMSTVHNDWLDNTGVDTISSSVTDIMNAALGNSPWSSATAYDPSTPLADAWTAVCALNTLVDALDHETDWSSAISAALTDVDDTIDPDTALAAGWDAITAFDTLVDALDHEADWASALAIAITGYDDSVATETVITDDINAFAQVLHEDLDNVQLPKFRAGYRDANAVLSSAFVIGEAIIYGSHQRDVAKYATGLREKNQQIRAEWLIRATSDMLKNQLQRIDFEKAVATLSSDHKMKAHVIRTEAITKSADVMLKNLMSRVEFEKAVAQLSVEAKRIHIVASKEEVDQGYSFDESDAKWDLEVFQYGNNVLAAIAGAAASTGDKRPSAASSAIGGAMSGMAAGSMIAPGVGTAIGGLIGLGAALFD